MSKSSIEGESQLQKLKSTQSGEFLLILLL